MISSIKEVHIKVSGRVQGVSFRKHTKQIADELGVKGYVRNEKDGSVFIVAQAETMICEKFIIECQKEYFPAKIANVVYDYQTKIEDIYTEFTIEKKHKFVRDQVHSYKNFFKAFLKR